MAPGPFHEWDKEILSLFIRIVARSLGLPRKALASTTWKRPGADRGIEADQCFYFTPAKIAAARAARQAGRNDSTHFPVPDLAVEVDFSQPQIDRPSIYATIGVAEIWRLVKDKVRIEQLNPDGTYRRSRTSRFLLVRDTDIRRRVIEEDSSEEAAWENRLIAWAGGLAKPRPPRRPRPGAGE